jgi:hypothetical protein
MEILINSILTPHMRTLLALLLVCMHGFAAQDAEFPVDYASSAFQQRKYECILMPSHLKTAPTWDSEKSPPPLRSKRAAQIALAEVEARRGRHSLCPESPGWELRQIALVEVHHSNVWYYRISVPPKAPGSGSFSPVVVFMTMDGKVIPLNEKT